MLVMLAGSTIWEHARAWGEAPLIGKLEIVADEAALAHSSAERFILAARDAKAVRGSFAVALAGGSTPKAMFALLAAEPLRSRVDWGSVRFFFGDERCVPPDHPDSNYGMAKKNLFDPLYIPATNIHRMRGEAAPEEAALEYQAILLKELGERPVLDLIFLGMGPEGHTALSVSRRLLAIRSRALGRHDLH